MIEDTMFDNDCYAVFMEEEHEKEKRVRDNISRQEAVDEIMKCRFVVDAIEKIRGLPSAEPKTDDENELKFYYVESIDDYWIGQRLDNFYYADWHECLGFVWSKSRYLPWGEHVVNEQTLWKEHTYPSEPKEIPFTMWIVGFLEKYSTDRPTGEWIPCSERVPKENEYVDNVCKYYLIQDEYGDMHVAHLSGRGWETIESIKALGCDVIAWMPLPEPYREDGEA